jgi:hypothetical protein
MVTWEEFAQATPDLAAVGKRLLYQYPVGYAYLGTIRSDGGPRIHPVCPALTHGHLYVFIEGESPSRYALHTFAPPEGARSSIARGEQRPCPMLRCEQR